MECYCVEKKKGIEACPELYCDWSPHDEHSLKFSVAHGFLSFTVTTHSCMWLVCCEGSFRLNRVLPTDITSQDQ